MKSVYLAGPIKGLSYDGANYWRDVMISDLAQHDIKGLSPMRCKEYLEGCTNLGMSFYDGVLSTPRGIMVRDRFDATRCDVMLVNLLHATTVTIGTCMEIAWADLKRIPVVAIMEDGNIHDHPMINEAVGFRVKTLEEARDTVLAILK